MGQYFGQNEPPEVRDRQSRSDRKSRNSKNFPLTIRSEKAPVVLSDNQVEYFNSILTDVAELYPGDDLDIDLFIDAFYKIILGCYNCKKETDYNYVFDRTMIHYNRLIESKRANVIKPVEDLNEGVADSVASVVPESGE